MAEVITETILPGTYIEVRAEGLLTIGAIATGNVGIVGSAEKGPSGPVTLSSLEDAKAVYGQAGAWDDSAPDENLSLVRALGYTFGNGARTVIASRAVNETNATRGSLELVNQSGAPILRMTAQTGGTWSGRLQARVMDADSAAQVIAERLTRAQDGSYALSAKAYETPDSPDVRLGTLTIRRNGVSRKYAIVTGPASEADARVQLNTTTGALTFVQPPAADARLTASYGVPVGGLKRVDIQFDNVRESYLVPSSQYLAQQLSSPRDGSTLVDGTLLLGGLPANTDGWVTFVGGSNGAVGNGEIRAALDHLVDQNIQLLHVAGQGFSQSGAMVLSQLEATENLGRERIAILGADASDLNSALENSNSVADKRLVLVSPGLVETDDENGQNLSLTPPYAAAAVTGKLAGLSPHVSITNKTLQGIRGLSNQFNYGEKTALVLNRVLTLEDKRGTRVIKGITTDDAAFKQITLRRIVDHVKAGTRLGANQYIGRLNNQRVRDALHTTLDSFLASLVNPLEYLVDYQLEVYSDRAMQIRGEVQVNMTLYPTFSIDVIRVTMNLN